MSPLGDKSKSYLPQDPGSVFYWTTDCSLITYTRLCFISFPLRIYSRVQGNIPYLCIYLKDVTPYTFVVKGSERAPIAIVCDTDFKQKIRSEKRREKVNKCFNQKTGETFYLFSEEDQRKLFFTSFLLPEDFVTTRKKPERVYRLGSGRDGKFCSRKVFSRTCKERQLGG